MRTITTLLLLVCTATAIASDDDAAKSLPGVWRGSWQSGDTDGEAQLTVEQLAGEPSTASGSLLLSGLDSKSDEPVKIPVSLTLMPVLSLSGIDLPAWQIATGAPETPDLKTDGNAMSGKLPNTLLLKSDEEPVSVISVLALSEDHAELATLALSQNKSTLNRDGQSSPLTLSLTRGDTTGPGLTEEPVGSLVCDGLGKRCFFKYGDWEGEWVRKDTPNSFDCKMRHSIAGEVATYTATISSAGKIVTVKRSNFTSTRTGAGRDDEFTGTLSDDGRSILFGTLKQQAEGLWFLRASGQDGSLTPSSESLEDNTPGDPTKTFPFEFFKSWIASDASQIKTHFAQKSLPAINGAGILVTRVYELGAIPVQANDVIVRIGNIKIKDDETLAQAIAEVRKAEDVELWVRRYGPGKGRSKNEWSNVKVNVTPVEQGEINKILRKEAAEREAFEEARRQADEKWRKMKFKYQGRVMTRDDIREHNAPIVASVERAKLRLSSMAKELDLAERVLAECGRFKAKEDAAGARAYLAKFKELAGADVETLLLQSDAGEYLQPCEDGKARTLNECWNWAIGLTRQ